MSCEINDNPCDVCEEPYCPDQLQDLVSKYVDLRAKTAYYAVKLAESKAAQDEYMKEHKDTLLPELNKL